MSETRLRARLGPNPASSVKGYSLPNHTSHIATADDRASLSILELSIAEQPTLQHVYDTAPIGLALLSPDCRYLQINQRLTEICGISVEDHIGRTVRECVPVLADAVEEIVRSIMTSGEPVIGVEVAGQRTDQPEQRSWITYWHPLRGKNGEIVGVNVAAEEITERKRAQAALQASERQFHTLADAIPQLVWMAHGDGTIFWFNGRWYDYTGLDSAKAGYCDWRALLSADTLSEMTERWPHALREGTALETELSLRGKDGRYRPFLTRIIPVHDRNRAIYMWIGTHIDISERKQREEHIRFISHELSHRTKNLLAVVMAVANQTAQYAQDVKQYQKSFSERLRALSHSHDLLLKESWHGASFHDLVSAQMEPFAERKAGRIHVAGPAILLRPEAVQHLGLALHELATNASKHGALSGERGEVSIQWQLDNRTDKVSVNWRESGGPPVIAPERRGFGHVVIEQIVPRALNGDGALNFASGGVDWTFEFPRNADGSTTAPRVQI
jgi:PAS domain S-box-containing protein